MADFIGTEGNDVLSVTLSSGFHNIDGKGGTDFLYLDLTGAVGNIEMYYGGTVASNTAPSNSNQYLQVAIGNIEGVNITTAGGNDYLMGTQSNDTLSSGFGNDILQFFKGVAVADGGPGTDQFLADLSDCNDAGVLDLNVNQTQAMAFIRGSVFRIENVDLKLGSGNQTITTLTGAAGAGLRDVIDAGAGDDVITVGGGYDSVVGGDGYDVLYVDFTGAAGSFTSASSGSFITNSLSEPALYQLTQSGFERVDITLADGADNVTLGGAQVTIRGGQGSDSLATGDFNDSLYGGDGGDILSGGAGDDVLAGGAGNDNMDGGFGNDVYEVTEVGDYVHEDAVNAGGVDTVVTFVSDYGLGAQIENLVLGGSTAVGFGNSGANGLFGNAANNTLIGGAGADLMVGYGGDDTYEVTDAGDLVQEAAGGGVDQVFSLIGSYVLADNVENLILSGGAVTGFGNGGANAVIGNGGANNLGGGGGDDFVVGGGGVDAFFWTGTSAGKDVLVDFAQANEKIVVSSSMFANFAAVQSHAFQAAGDTVIAYDSNTLLVLKNTTLANLSTANFVFSAGEPDDLQPQMTPPFVPTDYGIADTDWSVGSGASTFGWALA